MSSSIDPAKLKVVDLRNELSTRGLDTKGNKAALVKRLKNALEKEFDKDLPDTSIADTSTEDLDTSQTEETTKKHDESVSENIETEVAKSKSKSEGSPEKVKIADTSKPEIKSPEKLSEKQKVQIKSEQLKQDANTVEKSKVDIKSTEVKSKPETSKICKTEKLKNEPEVPNKNKTTEIIQDKPKAEKIQDKPKAEKIQEKLKTPEKIEKLKTPEKTQDKPKTSEKIQEKLKTPEKIQEKLNTPEKIQENLNTPEKIQEKLKFDKIKQEEKSVNIEHEMETDLAETEVNKSISVKLGPDPPSDKIEMETKNKQVEDKTSENKSAKDLSDRMETEEVKMKEFKSKESSQKGEKRKRNSESPERSQRRRSRSPVKENEPVIDNASVQLSWYDSDLHLQIDEKTFLSAKPLTEGVFGYAWAGVRTTHGVGTGKVFYEVKITEELKWEDDFSKQIERKSRNKRNSNKKNTENKVSSVKTENEQSSEKVESNIEKEKVDESSTKSEDKTVTEEKIPEKGETDKNTSDEQSEIKSAEKCEEVDNKTHVEMNETNTNEPMETEETKSEKAESDSKTKEDKIDSSDKSVEVSESIPTHIFRVGWSLLECSLQLGEEKHSYGYESSGRFVSDKQFVEYGIKFGTGDVIGAFLDIDGDTITMRYSINGEVQPVATTVDKSDLPENSVFFPHILSRNYAFELNLGDKNDSWFPLPEELSEFQYLCKIENKVAGPVRPENRADCEVLLMCGLPASGKTHWVAEHVAANPDKRYCVLGKTNMLDKMSVSGEPLKTKYKGRWSSLVDRMQKCLNKLVALAALRRRNYIIDQTNVFPSAQRRKMRPFEGFKRRAVILVVGDEEQARRQSLQEALEGKEVPDSTILEMKAAMTLPDKGDWIDEVIYAGVEETEAKEIVKKYNAKGKAAGYGTEKRFRDDRWQNRRNDHHRRNYRDSGYHSQRFEPRGRWMSPRPRGGGWNRERQDNRGPPAREWRDSPRDYHGTRGSYNQSSYSRGHNNVRGREQGSTRGHGGGRGQGRGQGWSGNSGGWGGHGWNQQTYGSGSGYSNQNWGSNGNQWKYSSGGGGGNNQHGYAGPGGWNYYGQYSQNWNQK